MSRSVPWRHTSSDAVHARQLQAMRARIYVLQENGPTAVTVKEHDSPKKLRVCLGDPCTCTCSTFIRERDLCIHILWVMLKLFRIPPENPISWQGALVEREIQQIVKSRESVRRSRGPRTLGGQEGAKTPVTTEERVVEPRPIEEGDCCPICQDEMTSSQHLTYCRYSCGHSIHSKCMKIWADHQISQGTKILCPMCRAEFGTLKMIMTDHLKQNAFRRDVHAGTTCNNCNVTPIQGKLYLCTICHHFSLCMQCFAGPNHTQHPFQFKEKPAHRWRPAVRDLSTLPPTLSAELENRDITENDYETLLALDNSAPGSGGLSNRELAALKCVMLTKTSTLLKQRDVHCGICLASYTISQHVVELPCSHRFHKVCAENWLAHTHDYCPTCNETVVVTLPQRKKANVVRYNQKEDIPEEPRLEFSMTGNALSSSTMTQGGSGIAREGVGNGGDDRRGEQENLNHGAPMSNGNPRIGDRPRNQETNNDYRSQGNGNRHHGFQKRGGTLQSSLRKKNETMVVGGGGLSNSSVESLQSCTSGGSAVVSDNFATEPDHSDKTKVVMKGRRASSLTGTPPSLIDVQGHTLSVGTVPEGSSSGKEPRRGQVSRPPRASREPPRNGQHNQPAPLSCDLDLRVGGLSESPVDIIRRISSVNERSNSPGKRRLSRESNRSPAAAASNTADIQPELVLVSGTRITTSS